MLDELDEGCFIRDMPKPFTNFRASFCTFSGASASRDRMGWSVRNTGGKGREGLFQVKQHPTGFIGSADDIFFSTEPGV